MEGDDPVLVVLVNSLRDWQIVETEHWYRVPVQHAPPHFSQASYVAFYFARTFGEKKWSIREYAPFRGHELVRRRDLLPKEEDHARADVVYYKLQLGPLISLARPIVSRSGRRLLFLWTTGGKFSRAVEINDLIHNREEDDRLWRRIRDQSIRAERQIVVRDTRARYRVDFWIPCAREQLDAVLANSTVPRSRGQTWRTQGNSDNDILEGGEGTWNEISSRLLEMGGSRLTSAE